LVEKVFEFHDCITSMGLVLSYFGTPKIGNMYFFRLSIVPTDQETWSKRVSFPQDFTFTGIDYPHVPEATSLDVRLKGFLHQVPRIEEGDVRFELELDCPVTVPVIESRD